MLALMSQHVFAMNNSKPIIHDETISVQVIYQGLKFPTKMAFLAPNDILVLEKNEGKVQRIMNGIISSGPLVKENVSTESERGMLGIAVEQSVIEKEPRYIFLYYTLPDTNQSNDDFINKKSSFASNHVYRYELEDNKLINPKPMLHLPSFPQSIHNGGVLLMGKDNYIYILVGSVSPDYSSHRLYNTRTQNDLNGSDADGRGGILRITQDGKPTEEKGILGDEYPLNLYYAYGIRNGFGMDFDPLTGNLWDTENAAGQNDEINFVTPGFNSGWKIVSGISPKQAQVVDKLVNFNGEGRYQDPKFVWNDTVGPTALKFLNTDKYGKQFENDMLVGDFHNGNIYHFDLNKDRRELVLKGSLADKIANDSKELQDITFGQGFGGITDMQMSPDGYLYILSVYEGGNNCPKEGPQKDCIPYASGIEGTIFKLVPNSDLS
jgi:glucose/arabinose dehydrogenase